MTTSATLALPSQRERLLAHARAQHRQVTERFTEESTRSPERERLLQLARRQQQMRVHEDDAQAQDQSDPGEMNLERQRLLKVARDQSTAPQPGPPPNSFTVEPPPLPFADAQTSHKKTGYGHVSDADAQTDEPRADASEILVGHADRLESLVKMYDDIKDKTAVLECYYKAIQETECETVKRGRDFTFIQPPFTMTDEGNTNRFEWMGGGVLSPRCRSPSSQPLRPDTVDNGEGVAQPSPLLNEVADAGKAFDVAPGNIQVDGDPPHSEAVEPDVSSPQPHTYVSQPVMAPRVELAADGRRDTTVRSSPLGFREVRRRQTLKERRGVPPSHDHSRAQRSPAEEVTEETGYSTFTGWLRNVFGGDLEADVEETPSTPAPPKLVPEKEKKKTRVRTGPSVDDVPLRVPRPPYREFHSVYRTLFSRHRAMGVHGRSGGLFRADDNKKNEKQQWEDVLEFLYLGSKKSDYSARPSVALDYIRFAMDIISCVSGKYEARPKWGEVVLDYALRTCVKIYDTTALRDTMREQLSVPLWNTTTYFALPYTFEETPNLNEQVLAVLAMTATREAKTEESHVDFVLSMWPSRESESIPTIEQCLVILGACRSDHRRGEQIFYICEALELYRIEQVSVRAMLALIAVYSTALPESAVADGVPFTLKDVPRGFADEGSRADEINDLSDFPQNGHDVRLVCQLLDIFVTKRQVQTIGLECLAVMARLSDDYATSVVEAAGIHAIRQAYRRHGAESSSICRAVCQVLQAIVPMSNTGTRLVLEAMEMALDILRRVTDNVLEITGDGGSDVSTLNAQTGMVPPEVAVRTVNCCLESRTMLVAARSTVSSGIPREQLEAMVQCFEVLAPATNPATAAEMLETSAVLCLNDGEESTDINQLNKELLLDAGYAGIPVLLLKRWCTLGHNPRLMRQACRAMLLLQYRSANGARHFARLRVHMVLVAEIQPNAKTGGAKALGRILALLADLCAGSTIADETVKKALRDYKTNPVKGQPKSSQTVVDLVIGALEIITQQEPDTPDFECLFQAARLFGAMLSREVPSEPSSESSVAGNASDAEGEARTVPVRPENQLMTRIEPVMGRYPATEGSELEVSLIVWCLINRRHATGQLGQGKIADRKGVCLLNLTTSDRDAFKSWQRGGEVPVETEIYAAFSQLAYERSEARPRLFAMKLFLNLKQYPVAHMLPSSAQRRTPAGLLLVHMFYSRLYRRLEVMAELGSEKAAIARLGAFFDPVRESELSSGEWGMGWLEVTDFLHDFEIVPTVCGMVVAQRAWLIVTDNDKSFSTRVSLEQLIHFVILLANYAYSAKKFETPLLMSRVRRFVRQLSLNKHKIVKKKLFDAYRDHHKFVRVRIHQLQRTEERCHNYDVTPPIGLREVLSSHFQKYSEYEDFTEIHRRLILKAAPTTVPKLMDRKYIPANEEFEAAVRMLSRGCYLDDTVVWEQYRFTHAFDLGGDGHELDT
ncbi:hypothetical protein FOZ60_008740 [Perkinsus olseni]|uniref:Uncharacterized protein n=1 Tax=Perkinsus olseni TaxID=32597 RepID=A0A7J6PFN1_PEROL|nr:hypothetical protein FOZ60_008740 [Perkinsus olseni]